MILKKRSDIIVRAIYYTSSLEAIYSQNKEALAIVLEYNVNIEDKGDIMVKPRKLKTEKVEERLKM